MRALKLLAAIFVVAALWPFAVAVDIAHDYIKRAAKPIAGEW